MLLAEAFESPDRYLGADLDVSAHSYAYPELVKIISEATGKQVNYKSILIEQARKMPFPGAIGFGNCLAQLRDARWMAKREKYPIVGHGPNFREWSQQHKQNLLAHIEASG